MKIQAFIPKHKMSRRYLDILNCSLNLTNRELDVLDLILDLDLGWDIDPNLGIVSGTPKNVVNTQSRRYIMLNTFINKNNLSKYIKKFKEKGILVEYIPKKWRVNTNIIPKNLDHIDVHFVLKAEEND